jgi:hypothetical protein
MRVQLWTARLGLRDFRSLAAMHADHRLRSHTPPARTSAERRAIHDQAGALCRCTPVFDLGYRRIDGTNQDRFASHSEACDTCIAAGTAGRSPYSNGPSERV